MKIGRNDPCFCGSGKKFKKCCMLANVASSAELHYRRLSEAYDNLFDGLVRHVGLVLGVDGGKSALTEYLLLDPGIEPEEEVQERQMGLFMPWMLFNFLSGSRTIAEIYAEEKGHLLGDLERALIDAVNRKPYTFYEILGVEPGKRVHFQEVFTESKVSVEERSGSKQLKTADLVFGRAVIVDGVGMIIGLNAYAIPPRYKPSLIELRRKMRKKGPVTFQSIFKWESQIRRTYLEMERALFSRPQLCNTDGDPLEFHKMVFDIESAAEAFTKLAPLCATETAEELFKSAERDPEGIIQRVEIIWSRMGHKMSAGMNNTILGNIIIEPRRLTVTVNSANRSRTIRREIESRLGKGARFRLDEVQNAKAMIEEAAMQGAPARKHSEEKSLMEQPEIRRRVAEMMKKHWEGWVDEKIPALGNRTPRRMVKTREGREAVEALLADAEKRMPDVDSRVANLEGIQHARRLLGLTKSLVHDE